MSVTTSIPLINGLEYSWGDIVAIVAGVPIIGITAIEYGDEQEVINHYGAGRNPISRSKGRITSTAKITVTQDVVVDFQRQSPTGRLQDLAPFPVIITYIPEDGIIISDRVMNCQFKKNSRTWKEGDTRQEIELELVPSHIVWHHKSA